MTAADDDRASRRVGACVFLVDVAFVVAIILVNRHSPVPPSSGTNTEAAIGWLSVIAAVARHEAFVAAFAFHSDGLDFHSRALLFALP